MDKLEFVSGTTHGGANGGANAARRLPISPYDPAVRRRNVRLGIILGIAAVAFLISSYWFVHHGWVQPGPITWHFPWGKPFKADF